ncbi:TetR/AcrR family transcriptional regulator [Streptomyces sp. NPDC048504]|uniref:TetR/AcrR family transcriptional regulator n=1 Tax=Streptomyces sp. NPDC048504 TaxID=3365559 RepID=UPI003711F25B
MARVSAQERHESVVRAAIAEFALKGYYGTSTEAIAQRVGVTQPYLFRLFPGKKAIFAAALARSMEDTRLAFERAADGAEGGDQTGELIRAGWMRLWETVHLSLGADVHETTSFLACGMLGNTLTAIGLSSDHREARA